MYTIKQLAEQSGVSTRTLRFYHEQQLLVPAAWSEAGYRLYSEAEVERLRQILLYRSMGIPLKEIKELLDQTPDQIKETLIKQKQRLQDEQKTLDQLVRTVEDMLDYYEGGQKMTENERFEAFKQEAVKENDAAYGAELQETYGEETIKQANQKFQKMSEEDYEHMQVTEQQLLENLARYVIENHTIDEDLAREIFNQHKHWLSFTWPSYSKEAHAGLAELYINDPRFAQYYEEKSGENTAQALHDIIQYYASQA